MRPYVPIFIAGLSYSQNALTMDEHDAIMGLVKDNRVASLIYLNKYGEGRWFRDPSRGGFGESIREFEFPTDAVEHAALTKSSVARAIPSMPFYEIAIPLAHKGEVLGLIDLQIGSLGVPQIIRKACASMPSL